MTMTFNKKLLDELAIKAGAAARGGFVEDPATGDYVWDEAAHIKCFDMDHKQFAALILLECERIAKDPQWYSESPSNGWRNPIKHVCNVMMDHFGIKQ